jgi:molybdopterin synthase catalytic subunit
LRDIVGRAEETVELAAGSRVADLYSRFGSEFPQFASLRSSVVASVNQELAEASALLQSGDEVAFLPPVSGGSVAADEDICELVHGPIHTREVVSVLPAPSDGAVIVFEGIVRNQSQGRETLFLDYQAYEPMARKQMRAILVEARARFSIGRMALVHRLGRLHIGETSVLIAVASPHRAAAFDATRFAIEAVKRSLPIWKKEHFQDGSVWVEGAVVAPVSQAGASDRETAVPGLKTFSHADESIT